MQLLYRWGIFLMLDDKVNASDDIFLNASWKKSIVVAITMPNFDKTKS